MDTKTTVRPLEHILSSNNNNNNNRKRKQAPTHAIDFESRRKKVREAFQHTLKPNSDIGYHVEIVSPENHGFPTQLPLFYEFPKQDQLDPNKCHNAVNELSTQAAEMLTWNNVDLPQLKESERLAAFFNGENSDSKETQVFIGQDKSTDPAAYRRERERKLSGAVDPIDLWARQYLRIPVIVAGESPIAAAFADDVQAKIEKVDKMQVPELRSYLDELRDRLLIPHATSTQKGTPTPVSIKFFIHHLHIFGLNEEEGLDLEALSLSYDFIRIFLVKAKKRAQKLHLKERKSEAESLIHVCDFLLKRYFQAYQIFALYRKLYLDSGFDKVPELKGLIKKDSDCLPTLSELGYNTEGNEESQKRMHLLMLYYIEFAETFGYKKGGSYVYEQRKKPNGDPTMEDVQVGNMDWFIQKGMQGLDQSIQTEIWHWVYADSNTLRALKNNLIKLEDPRFPNIRKNRNCLSFPEGVYHTQLDLFVYYDEMNAIEPSVRRKMDSAAKYHDLRFHNEYAELILDKCDRDWYNLPTPYLMKIFDAQGYDEEVKRFCMMAGGRMLQRLGTDNWQFILWCIGKAGTGKSTLANFFSYVFAKEDVGTLSQIVEPKFGMQHFVDPTPKLIVIAPDLSKGLGLPLPIFLNWISAESICIPRKGTSALETDMECPLIACSNVMALRDIRDALARRAAFLYFDKGIRKSNTRLLKLIVRFEMALILKKMTQAYWDYFCQFAHLDIWEWIPAYFRETRANLASESHSIKYFLKRSGRVHLLAHDYKSNKQSRATWVITPFNEVKEEYDEWVKKSLSKKDQDNVVTWTREEVKQQLEELGCSLIEMKDVRWPPWDAKAKTFSDLLVIRGVVLKKHIDDYEASLRSYKEQQRRAAGKTGKEGKAEAKFQRNLDEKHNQEIYTQQDDTSKSKKRKQPETTSKKPPLKSIIPSSDEEEEEEEEEVEEEKELAAAKKRKRIDIPVSL